MVLMVKPLGSHQASILKFQASKLVSNGFQGCYRGVKEEEGREVECIDEEMMRKSSVGIMVLGFIRFCRLGGVAYRGVFRESIPAMYVAYRGWGVCWATAAQLLTQKVIDLSSLISFTR
ncbi:hypothetical protein E3N88_39436 [Mikania micrantha]|uniref:Uncharacterized protein n=1 Tax=Mikania micrantha TaxID=192012 RepID=A0A5N6LWR7_9ASTR|nr:hypothetical protein E3N88_39436 [Mikania micrantha]